MRWRARSRGRSRAWPAWPMPCARPATIRAAPSGTAATRSASSSPPSTTCWASSTASAWRSRKWPPARAPRRRSRRWWKRCLARSTFDRACRFFPRRNYRWWRGAWRRRFRPALLTRPDRRLRRRRRFPMPRAPSRRIDGNTLPIDLSVLARRLRIARCASAKASAAGRPNRPVKHRGISRFQLKTRFPRRRDANRRH